jgi:hypothetical protein
MVTSGTTILLELHFWLFFIYGTFVSEMHLFFYLLEGPVPRKYEEHCPLTDCFMLHVFTPLA